MTARSDLDLLIGHLAEGTFSEPHPFHDWQILPVKGGANNLLYRVTSEAMDLAVKFTLRDARNRAEREFLALTALQHLGLRLSPAPVRLKTERYPYPVVVQEWLEGEVLTAPPQTDTGWARLLQLCAEIHSVTPKMTRLPIRDAVLGATTVEKAKQLVFKQANLIPQRVQSTELRTLLKTLASMRSSDLKGERALCHVDANVGNFILSSGILYAVDWEGSGWSDPAFEVANLMTHPAYLSVTRTRWEWLVDTYARLSRDGAMEERIGAYHLLLATFWVVRFARTLYEVPKGLDRRLVHRPDNWQDDAKRKYQHCLALASSLL